MPTWSAPQSQLCWAPSSHAGLVVPSQRQAPNRSLTQGRSPDCVALQSQGTVCPSVHVTNSGSRHCKHEPHSPSTQVWLPTASAPQSQALWAEAVHSAGLEEPASGMLWVRIEPSGSSPPTRSEPQPAAQSMAATQTQRARRAVILSLAMKAGLSRGCLGRQCSAWRVVAGQDLGESGQGRLSCWLSFVSKSARRASSAWRRWA